MEEKWQRRCTQLYGERDFKATTDSGIEVKLVYTPRDIAGMAYGDIGLSGQYPFTSGHSPLQYQVEPWAMRMGYGTATRDEDGESFCKCLACRRVWARIDLASIS